MTSRQANKEIIKKEENKNEVFGEQSSPFSKKHQENNRSLSAEDINEESQPEKLLNFLDVPGIAEIKHIPETEDISESKRLA
jgi:hypothetical protein